MQVLIADDDQSVRFILKVQLQSWGYDVIICEDGEEALGYLTSARPPRIAILDWMMDGYTGVEICSILKNTQPLIYIILLTAKASEENLVEAINSGAHCFQTKPVSPGVLRSHIDVGKRLIHAEDKLLTQEREIRLQCYGAIADLAEARHNNTGKHMQRISLYTHLLAVKMGLPQEQCEDIAMSSRFHDIGKVGIADTILLSQDSYTEAQRSIMTTHTVIGYEILATVPTLQTAARIARHHHEKWDGTGYPDGISGEKIPIEARIVSIVDVYDALRSQRIYKESWDHERTLTYLKDLSGSSFDPKIMDIFLRHHQQFNDIFLANQV
jgi:putative two-component system response regulator